MDEPTAARPQPVKLILWALAGAGLYAASLYNYLLFHVLAEGFSIVVAFGVFMIAWNARRFLENDYLLFVGTACVFVASLDVVHTLAYRGMGVLAGDEANTATQLWIAARYLQSLSLLLAPWYVRHRLRVELALAGYAAAVTVLLLAIFAWGVFPDCFVPGSGLTPFKKLSEYFISGILLAAIVMLLRQREHFDRRVLTWLLWAMAFTILSEMAFTFYVNVYGLSNFIGHLFKILAFYLIYEALIDTGLSRPYALLFRNLKQSEETLRASEQRYRSLVEMSPDAVFINRDQRLVYANSAALSLFGASAPDQLLGKSPYELFHPDFHPVMRERLGRLLAGEPAPLIEGQIVQVHGALRDVEVVASPFDDRDGRAIQVILRDITARKQAEAALRQNQALLRAVMETTSDPIYVKDVHSRVLMCNPALEHVAGKPAAEIIGKTDSEYYDDPATGQALRENDLRVMESGRSHTTEETVKTPDGCRIFLSSKAPYRDASGNIVGILGISHDITERKRAEQALRESEQQFRHFYESPLLGVIFWNIDGTITDANDKFLQMVGYTRADLAAGRLDWAHMTPPEYRHLDEASERELTATGVNTRPIEKEYIRKDGSRIPILVAGAMLDEARFNGVAFVLDITTRKQAEEALQHAKAELEQRVQERTGELSQAVGDLQTEVVLRTEAEHTLLRQSSQLRALASELTLAEQRERRRVAEVLHDSVQQLLVGARLQLIGLQRGQEEAVSRTAREVEELINQSLATSRSLTYELSPPMLYEGGLVPALEWLARWTQDKHGLTVTVTATGPVTLEAEDARVLLFQAVRELLFNIVKHAQVQTASVQVDRVGDQIRVLVGDDGVGFEPAQLTAEGGSTGGFGLLSIRERLTLLGGRMEIDSAPGQGTRFTLWAPLRRGGMASDRAPVRAEQPDDASSVTDAGVTGGVERKIRVLVVDDHRVVRQGLTRLLAAEPDIEIVAEAADGKVAVELAGQLMPDVVLMDVSMPEMNGVDATRAIHAAFPSMQVIGLSMFEEDELAAMMRKVGAVAYLTKRGPADALLATIRSCAAASSGC